MTTRTLNEIKQSLSTLEKEARKSMADLRRTQKHMAAELSNTAGSTEKYRAVTDEWLPRLDEAERATLATLEHAEHQLREDLKTIDSLPYRPDPSIKTTDSPVSAIRSLSLDDLAAEMDATAFHEVKSEYVMWSMHRSEIMAKLKETGANGSRSAGVVHRRLQEFMEATEDRSTRDLRESVSTLLSAMVERQTRLVTRRVAHDPTPGFGSMLLSASFGNTPAKSVSARRYDPDDMAIRLDMQSGLHILVS